MSHTDTVAPSGLPSPAESSDRVVIDVRGVGRRHPDGQGWLLEDIWLQLRRGDRLAVAGPSGSGKTLLLRALALLDPVDQGNVLWLGHPVHRGRVPEFRSQLVYLHQRPAFFEEHVEAALRAPFSLKIHRMRRFDRQQALGWMAGLGRDPSFLTKPMRNLSGGEMQIVALVRALALEPATLLLDEPTASLDQPTAQAAEDLLGRWAAERPDRSLVWVSHDTAMRQRVTNRTIHIEGGRLVDPAG